MKSKIHHTDVLFYEKDAWRLGCVRTAGIDEAGRGALAGPVVAAAVIFDPAYIQAELTRSYGGLTDSKAMTANAREACFRKLEQSEAVEIGLGMVEAKEIDQINILKATHKAMNLASKQVNADFALVDGLPLKRFSCGHRAIIRGDALSISISAASVAAKVTRDRKMKDLDINYPSYGFAEHKGYGTRKHLEALKIHGASPVHRRSFRPVAERNKPSFWNNP